MSRPPSHNPTLSIHSSIQSLHNRNSPSGSSDQRRLVDQFYENVHTRGVDDRENAVIMNGPTNTIEKTRPGHGKSKSKDFLLSGSAVSSTIGLSTTLGINNSNSNNNSNGVSGNSSQSSVNGINGSLEGLYNTDDGEEIVNKLNEYQQGILQKISDVINDTQDVYESDYKEITDINSEIEFLKKRVNGYVLIIEELINKMEIKFKKFLYEFLNNFLSYLKILEVLQDRLNKSNDKLKKHKEILSNLNEKIDSIESMNQKNDANKKIRTKWLKIVIVITLMILILGIWGKIRIFI